MMLLATSRQAVARLRAVDRRWATGAWAAVVIALGLWYYWNVLGWPLNGFARWDRPGRTPQFEDAGDVAFILERVDEGTSPAGMWRWVTHPWTLRWTSYYRPVALASFWMDRVVWGNRGGPYHAHNLVLHLLNAMLLAALVSRVARSRWPGAVAGLIWAAYPTTMVATTWIAGRCDLLAAFFYLWALLLVLAMRREGSPWFLWPGAVACFVLALGSKEMAVTLPVLVTAWMLVWPDPPPRRRRALIAASFWAALAVFWAVRWHAMGTLLTPTVLPHQPFEVKARLWYARFLAGPATEWFLFPPWSIGWASLLTPGFYKFMLRQAVFWFSAVLLLRTATRATLAFIAWKAVVVLPIFVAVHFFAWSHYWYLPSMGTVALLGLAAWQVGLLAGRWWPRLATRLKRIESRPTR